MRLVGNLSLRGLARSEVRTIVIVFAIAIHKKRNHNLYCPLPTAHCPLPTAYMKTNGDKKQRTPERRSLADRYRRATVISVLLVILSMAITLLLAVVGLDGQLFWDDEANTAIYARNWIEQGKITAWDGHNLLSYAQGGSLGADLGPELRVPVLPAFIAATGMFFFGPTTFAARLPFVLLGVLAVGLTALWARRHYGPRFPWWLPSLLLALSPVYLLFIRNCRYYGPSLLFTVALFCLFSPGVGRWRGIGRQGSDRSGRRDLIFFALRLVATAVVTVLLILTHYLNALAALVLMLLLVVLDRRYRRFRELLVLGTAYLSAFVCGVWLLIVANPFQAKYTEGGSWLHDKGEPLPLAERFFGHLWKLFRDVGTHEYFPWLVLLILPLPLLIGKLRPLRSSARRAWILVAMVPIYLLLAAALTPSDMGGGEVAEMRYVVPLIALGAMVASSAVFVLWRLFRPLATLLVLLLVFSNVIHLGMTVDRLDGSSSLWPPTIVRYVHEIMSDSTTGNEELIEVLQQLPLETTVRTFPEYVVYPPMFYVPGLRYLDQLDEDKPIDPALRTVLPDYVYTGRVVPDIVVVPTVELEGAMKRLVEILPDHTYEVRRVLANNFQYTSRPELASHSFPIDFESIRPKSLRMLPLSFAILVRDDLPTDDIPVLRLDRLKADELIRQGALFDHVGMKEEAVERIRLGLKRNPIDPDAHYYLGEIAIKKGNFTQAVVHFKMASEGLPDDAMALTYYADALTGVGRLQEAEAAYINAIEMNPDIDQAHYNLARLLAAASSPTPEKRKVLAERAERHYRETLRISGDHIGALNELAIILMELDRSGEAIGQLTRAIDIDNGYVQAHVNLARALRMQGNRLEAMKELQIALSLLPPDSPMAGHIRALENQWLSEGM